MIPTSFRTRGVHFAYLFGPPKVLTRQDGVAAYEAVCQALGVDDLTFKYATPGASPSDLAQGIERSRPFSIEMERRLGRGVFKITIDNRSIDTPIRFLSEFTWPPSREHVNQDFDAAAEAVFSVLGSGLQKVLAEARIRGQAEAQNGSAIVFLTQGALRLGRQQLDGLEAPLTFASVALETPPGDPTELDPLRQPKREMRLEVLREDPRSVYIELMSQWPQLAAAADGSVEIDTRRIRPFDSPPSAYIRNCMEFLSEKLLPFFPLRT